MSNESEQTVFNAARAYVLESGPLDALTAAVHAHEKDEKAKASKSSAAKGNPADTGKAKS